MATLTLQHIAHSYTPRPVEPADYAVRPLDLTLQDGVAYALLGPSGCGKTTLLNIISGLIHPTQGRVLFNDQEVTNRPTAQRNIAQVFQFPVVYDTMTVYDNLAFPLRNRRIPKPEIKKRVHRIAELLDLTDALNRRARGVSADLKQMISLGRGLVRDDVAAVLFDEPLTVIDPQLKWTLRRTLKQIHRELALTLLYVTHDQTEALTFANEVLVMHEGTIVQQGTPQALFEAPTHPFVGYFIGAPGMNLLPAHTKDGTVWIGEVKTPKRADQPDGTRLTLGIRPEFITYTPAPHPNALPAQIEQIEDLGHYLLLTARIGAERLMVRCNADVEVKMEEGWLIFPPQATCLFNADALSIGNR